MILIYFVGAVLVVALLINLFKNDDEINKRTLKYFLPAFLVVSFIFLFLYGLTA
jgi:flagellar biosynthesis protein FliQ|tara:strand:- start:691 stop:852 length:162 start_codon:yes stop_codon:yes gene_type:complete